MRWVAYCEAFRRIVLSGGSFSALCLRWLSGVGYFVKYGVYCSCLYRRVGLGYSWCGSGSSV